jgi:hypothetical protein
LTSLSPTAAGLLEGERRKLDALASLEARRGVYVRRGRRALLLWLLCVGTATADDVRATVELPLSFKPRLFGPVPEQLAAAGIIASSGYVRTARPKGLSRPVRLWELVDRAAALVWLAVHTDSPDPGEGEPEQPTLFDH